MLFLRPLCGAVTNFLFLPLLNPALRIGPYIGALACVGCCVLVLRGFFLRDTAATSTVMESSVSECIDAAMTLQLSLFLLEK
jgi:hypothetical protein